MMKDIGPVGSGICLSCSFKTLALLEEYASSGIVMHITDVIILIVGFIIINYILEEFTFEEKKLNEISENKFSSKITRYAVLG